MASLILLGLIACATMAFADLMDSTIYITTPRTVQAGTPFNATVNVQWHGLADSGYAYAFRIYLATSYKEQSFYWYDPECYLIKEQTLCDASIKVLPDYIGFYDTPFTVTIPPTVGPSGAHYTLIGRIINTDGSYYGSTWESDVFKLDGANGTWANYQMNNRQLWGDDGISCSGFACVKDCAGTETGFGGTGTTDGSYQSCANACPGVYIDPSSSVGGQPTASLTRPPVCPETSQASRNGNSLIPLRTLSRTPAEPTATVASDTSDARFLSSKSWVTMAMALMAVGWTINQK